MSIGNTKDYGNKGNNFPYQLRNLQLLGEILDALNNASPAGRELYPYMIYSTGTGDLSGSTKVYNASFYNEGSATVSLTVGGSGTFTIPAGATVNYDPGVNNYYNGNNFSWDATGSNLLVSYTAD